MQIPKKKISTDGAVAQTHGNHKDIHPPSAFTGNKTVPLLNDVPTENKLGSLLNDAMIETAQILREKGFVVEMTDDGNIKILGKSVRNKVTNPEMSTQNKVATSEKSLQNKVATSEKPLQNKVATSEKPLLNKVATPEKPLQNKVATSEKPPLNKVLGKTVRHMVTTRKMSTQNKVTAPEKPPQKKVAAFEKFPKNKVAELEVSAQNKVAGPDISPQNKVIVSEMSSQNKVKGAEMFSQNRVAVPEMSLQNNVAAPEMFTQNKVKGFQTYPQKEEVAGSAKTLENRSPSYDKTVKKEKAGTKDSDNQQSGSTCSQSQRKNAEVKVSIDAETKVNAERHVPPKKRKYAPEANKIKGQEKSAKKMEIVSTENRMIVPKPVGAPPVGSDVGLQNLVTEGKMVTILKRVPGSNILVMTSTPSIASILNIPTLANVTNTISKHNFSGNDMHKQG